MDYSQLPLSFEVNYGQSDPGVRFLTHGRGYAVYLRGSEAVLRLRRSSSNGIKANGERKNSAMPLAESTIHMALMNAKSGVVSGEERLPGTANYFIGDDPAHWHRAIPTYGRVKYASIYPGIDLVYHGKLQQLEYDFLVAPGADAAAIRLHFSGADRIAIDRNGDLKIESKSGSVTFEKPLLYQSIGKRRTEVQGGFSLLRDRSIGFRVGSYDHRLPLVIDPTLAYSGYLGGSTSAVGYGIAVDASGSAYVTGKTYDLDFPGTTGSYQPKNNGKDSASNVFIAKFNPAGTALVYATYLGGSGDGLGNGDSGAGIAVDGSGNAYISGATNSQDFPTVSAYQAKNPSGNGSVPFVAKLNPTGTELTYSTYLGGSGNGNGDGDVAYRVAVNAAGNAYVIGNTFSQDFPTLKPIQPANQAYVNSGSNAFISELSTAGSALVFSTYLGGSGITSPNGDDADNGDAAAGIALDGAGNIYVAGYANSADFPLTAGSYQQSNNANDNQTSNAFVAALNPTGSKLIYSTYLGGSGVTNSTSGNVYGDQANAIAVDSTGNVYVSGLAFSANFPVSSTPYQSKNLAASQALSNAFVSKLDPTGSKLLYSTYLGGTGGALDGIIPAGDYAYGIAADKVGDAYVVGVATSPKFPVTTGAYQPQNNAAGHATNAFVTEINPAGNALVYSTYLGGTGLAYTPYPGAPTYFNGDYALAVALDPSANLYTTGQACSRNFPVAGAPFQKASNSTSTTGCNAFVSKISFSTSSTLTPTTTSLIADSNPQNAGVKVTFTAYVEPNSGTATATGMVTFSIDGTGVGSVALDATGHALYQTGTLAAGTHTVTASYAGNSTFAASSGELTETIFGPPATITILYGSNQSTVYGSVFPIPLIVEVQDVNKRTLPGVNVAFSGAGLSFSPTSAVTDSYGEVTVSATATAAGTLTAAAAVSGISKPATFSLTALKAPLTITATNAGIPFGQAIPAFTYTATGFVNGDTVKVLTGTPLETTTASKGSTYGTYPIAITAGTLAAANYSFQFINATLTINALGTTAVPKFSPAAGLYNFTQIVTTSDATPGAVIYYAINATPTTASTKYNAPITVSKSEVVEALAVAPGYYPSSAASASYTLQVAPVTFSPAPATYILPQSVSLADATPASTMYYTTNGTAPTTSSAKYASPIAVRANETIEAIAVAAGFTQSNTATAVYTITPPAATPVLSPASGTFTTSQAVTITDATPGASIFYTTNGTTPTTASASYTGPITVLATETVQAVSIASGYSVSAKASGVYTIHPPPLSGIISTIAGTGAEGYSGNNGFAVDATLNAPTALYAASTGTMLIADTGNNVIRGVTSGVMSNVAGDGTAGYSGDGGPGVYASLDTPTGIAGLPSGIMSISDSGNSVIRQFGTYQNISTTAGDGDYGFSGDGDAATKGTLNYPGGVAYDLTGNLYIADTYNQVIRKVSASGIITTVAGNGNDGYTGNGGQATSAMLSYPGAVAVDASGNLYIADTGNSAIREVSLSGIITTIAGNGNYGYSGDGGSAISAMLSSPTGIAIDTAGSLYIADSENNVIRERTPDGIIHTIAGNGTDDYSGDGGAATSAGISLPSGVAVDSTGILYISDTNNNVIRKVERVTVAPVFSPPPGSYTSAQTLTITDATAAAAIYYTTNGTIPTSSSTPYSAPIAVPATETIKAIAVTAGYSQSAVTGGTFTITPLAAVPSSASFGSIAVGATSPTITVTVTNYTNYVARYLSYSNLDDFNFEPGTCGPISTGTMLAGGTSCNFKVTFSPTASGAVSGSFTISTVAGPITYNLSGTGTTAQSSRVPVRTVGQPIAFPIDGSTQLPSQPASASGQLLVIMSRVGGPAQGTAVDAESAFATEPDASATPAASDVPAGAQPAPATPNVNLVVMTVWYADFNACTTGGTGTITSSPTPKYGSVSSQNSSVKLPPGFPCAGVFLPATQAFYKWNNPSPVTLTDAFTLNYVSDDKTQATSKSVFAILLGGGTGKVKIRPGGCSTCSKVDPGDPIDLGSGNVFEEVDDYATYGANKLSFSRYYNSLSVPNTTATMLGDNWRSTYDRYLNIISSTLITAERPDGEVINFTLKGSIWTPPADADYSLVQNGLQYVLTDPDDNIETYGLSTAVVPIAGISLRLAVAPLQTIKARNGYTQTLNRTSGVLESVTDSYGRRLSFTYIGTSILTVTTPDGLVITYGYNTLPGGTNNQLVSVSYSTNPVTSQKYLYANTALPLALTGITDENGHSFASWTYDQLGRGTASQFGPGAEASAITYNDGNGSRVLTGPLGESETYKFTVLQTVPKVTEIDRLATSTTAAAKRLFTYDANGYLASQTDWNGNLTKYVNNPHGEPTSIVEASGTPVARTTGITWLTNFHLPSQIVTPGLTFGFTYDSLGELLTKTLTDTTTQTNPYATSGQARTTTYTWLDSLLASVETPLKNTTSFTYDASGSLVKIVNPLLQATNITEHSGGGQPETIVDPNNVTTRLTYDPRRYLIRSELATRAGVLTTTLNHDAAENLVSVDLPGGSELSYIYDTAHRLTGVTDKLGNNATFTLDALADQTAANVYAKGSTTASGQHSATFDALGRKQTDIGGVGQTTTFTYDNQGNALTITDPLTHKATQLFDALNRLAQVTDANGGITTVSYDAHDRPLKVTAPNGAVTTHVYDGFGDAIEQVSADSGTTVYHYDADANLTSKTDALKIVSNYSFDKLDRTLTATYPADTTKNVTYTYDQTDHGFGVGRLTGMTDAVGTLSRTYDERGNLLSEKRTNGTNTLTTGYTYDPASRLESITYPSGAIVRYTLDPDGGAASVSVGTSAGAATTVTSGMSYLPFGPVSGLTFGNGIAEIRAFDLDYRTTNITDTGASAVIIQKLTYNLNAANNITGITDGVTAGSSQTLGYDAINRLTSATGVYGVLGYTYDKNGNRLTQTLGTVKTAYDYVTNSNRLASIIAGTVTTPVVTNANGQITSIPPANSSAPATFGYNVVNQLASVTGVPLTTTYTYTGFSQRFSKANAGSKPTLFTYAQDGSLLEENDNGVPTDYLWANGMPVATFVPSTSKVYFLHTDHLGTPQLATDSSQKTVWKTTYQPFGETGTIMASITQNLRLPGQYADAEDGLNHNGFRDYAPALGRYAQTDRIGLTGGMNSYAYTTANPMKWTDEFGLYEGDYSCDKTGMDCDPRPQSYPPYSGVLGMARAANCYGSVFLGDDSAGMTGTDARKYIGANFDDVTGSPIQVGDVFEYYYLANDGTIMPSHVQRVISTWGMDKPTDAIVHTLDHAKAYPSFWGMLPALNLPIYEGPADQEANQTGQPYVSASPYRVLRRKPCSCQN